ncbi:ferritin-like domain-containing protein [Christiangramia sabulilitoris]|uniref:Ferritin-like domain-containing protein n=1 Tax=Christiangramia sabulilitoris TaxID=2583991 RepID=A0A550I7U8_9FLAO|nr:ferritin-like domain-containing protein [Christiangramia sabulilitoris]TRO66898.1 ferritin-like domain-containing protein [Christiangramia sabulilitoris]
MKKPKVKVDVIEASSKKSKNNSRRKFIKLGGLGIAGSSFLLYGCNEDDLFDPGGERERPQPQPEPDPDPEVFDLGSGDVGILNYAYALEQLEAAFYTQVRAGGYYAGAPQEEKDLFDDLYNHEVIHRDFFKVAITAAAGEENTLPDLEFDVSSIDFDSRDSVLATAMALEDTGVGAYNGAGDRIADATYLTLAGKIVSVEARHASAIRSLINPDSADFAGDDIIDENGLDLAYDPSEVFEIAGGFISTDFTADNLPEPMTGA